MYEFTKTEQEKITEARAQFNEELASKNKDKNLFGKMFKGKKDKSKKNTSNNSFAGSTGGNNSTQ